MTLESFSPDGSVSSNTHILTSSKLCHKFRSYIKQRNNKKFALRNGKMWDIFRRRKKGIINRPWKELKLRVLEAMSLAATLPQFPLPTTVTLDFWGTSSSESATGIILLTDAFPLIVPSSGICWSCCWDSMEGAMKKDSRMKWECIPEREMN